MYTKPCTNTRITLVLHPLQRLLTFEYAVSQCATCPPIIRGKFVSVSYFKLIGVLPLVLIDE